MLMQKMTLHNMGHSFYKNPQYRHNMVEDEKDPEMALNILLSSKDIHWAKLCLKGKSAAV